jgi:hypothetical protein
MCLLGVGSWPAEASPLVDTGEGPNNSGGYSLYYAGPDNFQFLAASFTLSSDAVITSVMGWIGNPGTGDLDLAIYGDSVLPTAAPLLFNTTVAMTFAASTGASWRGASGLNWGIASGTYWLVLMPTVASGTPFAGAMPFPVPNPLARYAYYTDGNAGWAVAALDFGVCINCEAAATPEPSIVVLLGVGIAALPLVRRPRSRT